MLSGEPQDLNISVAGETCRIGTARVTSIVPGSKGVGRAEIEIKIGSAVLHGMYVGGNWKVFTLNDFVATGKDKDD